MNGAVRWQKLGGVGALALVLGLGSLTGRAVEAENFARGNERYAAGDYVGATRAYEVQVHSGRLSANLFYNLGDAYFRTGDKGRAVLNYRRALVLEPAQSEAAANLAFVSGGKTEGGLGSEPIPYRRETGAWIAAACGWLGLAGLLWTVVNRRRRSTVALAVAATGLLLCATGIGTLWYFSGGGGSARAIVVAEGTPALYSPVEGAKRVTTLAAGSQVRVLSEQGAWTYVLLGDETTLAWINSKAVERFVPR